MSSRKQTYFSESWLTDQKVKDWVAKGSSNTKAKCNLCKKTFKLSKNGVGALTSHAGGETHKKLMKADLEKNLSLLNMLSLKLSQLSSLQRIVVVILQIKYL